MPKRIKLTEENFELPESIHYSKDEDVILGIRLFNLILAKKVIKQILDDQNWREVYTSYYWLQEIIKKGTNWYDGIKEKAEKWDKFSSQCIIKITDNGTTIEPIINRELEQENKQLKKIVGKPVEFWTNIRLENTSLKQKLEKIKKLSVENHLEYEGFYIQKELKEILESKNE